MHKVIQEFLNNGFTQEEVFKIIKIRRSKKAFAKIDVSNRIQGYISFFQKYHKSKSEIIKKLRKTPRLFCCTPEFIERNFLSMSSFFEISFNALAKADVGPLRAYSNIEISTGLAGILASASTFALSII